MTNHAQALAAAAASALRRFKAEGMITIIPPIVSTYRFTPEQAAAHSQRIRELWARRRAEGHPMPNYDRSPTRLAAREWLALGPQPRGTLGLFAAERNLSPGALYRAVDRENKRRGHKGIRPAA